MLDPKQSLALQLSVFQLIEQGRLDEAEMVLDQFEPREQRGHRFLNTVGMLRLEQGDFPAAITLFEQALKTNVSIPEVRYNLALSYELSGECAQAHEKWLIYLQADTNVQRRDAVLTRLETNFETEGGRCYGWERPR